MESMLYNLFIAIVLLLLISILFWLIIINLLQLMPKKVKNTEPIKFLCVQIKEQQEQQAQDNRATTKLIKEAKFRLKKPYTDEYLYLIIENDALVYTNIIDEALIVSAYEAKIYHKKHNLFPCPVNE